MHQIRKDKDETNLSTADIANPSNKAGGPQLVQGERQPVDRLVRDSSERHDAPLFPDNELQGFRSRWDKIQTGFVDEPRKVVEEADSLVASMVKRIAEQFAEERARLEQQWEGGDNVSTEDLRQALRHYRSFFDRLLSV
jgi:hypothetical protein